MATTDVISLDLAMQAVAMTGSGAKHGEMVQLFVSGISEIMDEVVGPIRNRTISEEYDAEGEALIFLRSQPVVSVTSVTEYIGGTGTLLTAEDIDTSGGYLLTDGRLARRTGFYDGKWWGRVAVTYVAGRAASLDAVPARFQLAAVQILERMWPQYANGWARGGDAYGAPEGAVGFFRSVQPVVEEILLGASSVPSVG